MDTASLHNSSNSFLLYGIQKALLCVVVASVVLFSFYCTPALGSSQKVSLVSGSAKANPSQQYAEVIGSEDLPVKLNTVISLRLKELSLEEALRSIAEKADLDLVYGSENVSIEKEVSLNLEHVTAQEALKEVLRGTELGLMKLRGGQIVIVRQQDQAARRVEPARLPMRPPAKTEPLALQTGTITGTVVDSTSGEPLPGVNVMLVGTQQGASTDANGEYTIPGVEAGTYAARASFVGYRNKTKEGVKVQEGQTVTVNFALASSTAALEEVVVVGYGEQSTRELSSSVAKISAEELEDQPVTQLAQKLQGKISGVQIKQTTGVPGEGMDIRIRGAASITAGNNPLIVVDGNPIIGGMDNINPNEIESISVLKDAAAKSLYGSRAANGVVLVETKKAVAGQPLRASYSSYVGMQQVPQRGRPDMMTAREFATFKKEIAGFRGLEVNPAYQNPDQYGEGTDWYDAITQAAPIQSHNLTLSGSTENFSATGIAGFSSQEGVVVGTGYRRFSLRINSSFHPNDKLNIGLNIAPTVSENSNISRFALDGAVRNALITSPLAPLRNSDGSLTLTATSPGMFPNPNWVRTLEDRHVDNDETQILGNMFVEYEIIDGLLAKTAANVDMGETYNFVFNPTTTGNLFSGLNTIPNSSLYQNKYLSWTSENTLNYQIEGDHSLDVLGGFTAQKYRLDASNVQGDNYPDNKIRTISAANTVLASSDVQEWSLLSFLARANYNYLSKYLVSASIRRDGSSRFGENNRWGNFPALSVGWILSNEGFMPEIEPVSFLKLRASYGVVGNFSIGNYTHIPTLSSTNYVFGDNIASGRSVDNLADQNLGWESNEEYNIGLDLNLLNDRVEVTYNYYRKNTNDLLYNVRVPQASGFSNIQTNIGELKFWGHEFSVRTANIESDNLTWRTNFNISFDRNEVVSLGTQNASLVSGYGSGIMTGSNITKVGEPIGMIYGMTFEGQYQSQEDLENSATHTTSQVGTVKYRDTNGDGVITWADATIIGNPYPDFSFGMVNTVRYQSLDLSVAISGAYGNEVIRGAEQSLTNLDGVFNVLSDVKYRWRSPQDPGRGRYGSVASGTTFPERDMWGTQFLYDASHLTIQNITLGYTIPTSSMTFLSRLRLYGSVQRAYIFTNYPGPNPQVSYSGGASTARGIDYSSYPVPRIYSFGVNVGF